MDFVSCDLFINKLNFSSIIIFSILTYLDKSDCTLSPRPHGVDLESPRRPRLLLARINILGLACVGGLHGDLNIIFLLLPVEDKITFSKFSSHLSILTNDFLKVSFYLFQEQRPCWYELKIFIISLSKLCNMQLCNDAMYHNPSCARHSQNCNLYCVLPLILCLRVTLKCLLYCCSSENNPETRPQF